MEKDTDLIPQKFESERNVSQIVYSNSGVFQFWIILRDFLQYLKKKWVAFIKQTQSL